MAWLILGGVGGIVLGVGFLVTLLRSDLSDEQVIVVLSVVICLIVALLAFLALSYA